MNFTQFFWLILIAFIVALIARRFRAPYALALVLTGLALGAPHLMPEAHLAPDLLFTVFLPPLLFESAINLRVQALHADWKPIALYTLLGTVASTFIVGGLTAWWLQIPPATGLVFGALISTTDPISVIAVFKRLGANRRLMLIVEAESLFNNDTAVVLFTIMMGALAGGHVSLWAGIGQFLQLVLGGALLGIGIATAASRIHYELDDHLIEITLTTVVAFGSYLGAEALHVSGVMAVVTAGLVVGNYGMPRVMSPGTRLAVSAFWEYAAFVVNSIVFLLVGIEVAHVAWAHRLTVALAAIVAVLLGRAAIYPISILVNRLRGDIPAAWQHVLFWGGLRGALSMALALGLRRDFPQRDALVAATFAVVLFSLLVQGSTAGALLTRLGLNGRTDPQVQPEERRIAGDILACEAALDELERLSVSEAAPNWKIASQAHAYRTRLEALEAAMEQINPDHRAVQNRHAREAQRRALAAEKNALREAAGHGWIDASDRMALTARIDAELAALDHEPHPS